MSDLAWNVREIILFDPMASGLLQLIASSNVKDSISNHSNSHNHTIAATHQSPLSNHVYMSSIPSSPSLSTSTIHGLGLHNRDIGVGVGWDNDYLISSVTSTPQSGLLHGVNERRNDHVFFGEAYVQKQQQHPHHPHQQHQHTAGVFGGGPEQGTDLV